MKNILGLDLGSSSIGWSVIRENSEEQELVAMGSRVVSLTAAELSSFTQGNGVSINSQRTQKRTQRKGYDRYQLRRTLLRNKLDINPEKRNEPSCKNEVVQNLQKRSVQKSTSAQYKKAPKKTYFFGAFLLLVFWLSHQKSLTLNNKEYIIFGF